MSSLQWALLDYVAMLLDFTVIVMFSAVLMAICVVLDWLVNVLVVNL